MSMEDYQEFKKHFDAAVAVVNKYPDSFVRGRALQLLSDASSWVEPMMTEGTTVKDVPLGKMS